MRALLKKKPSAAALAWPAEDKWPEEDSPSSSPSRTAAEQKEEEDVVAAATTTTTTEQQQQQQREPPEETTPKKKKKKKKETKSENEEVAAAYLAKHGENDDLDQLIARAILEANDGRERKRLGATVEPSPHEVSELELLAARVAAGQAKNDGESDSVELTDRPRILLKSGRLLKEGTEALIRSTSWREAFLFNDAFALAKEEHHSLVIRSWVRFDETTRVTARRTDDDRLGFELVTTKRRFRIVGGDALEEWLETLVEAFLAFRREVSLTPLVSLGWRHKFVTGTTHWLALYASPEQLTLTHPLSQRPSVASSKKKSGVLDDDDDDDGGDKEKFYFSTEEANALSSEGLAPCHLAAAANRVHALSVLSATLGASPHTRSTQRASAPYLTLNAGATPLHFAAAGASLDCALELLGCGADPGARDDNGETPFDAAATSATCEEADSAVRTQLFHVLPRLPDDESSKQGTHLHTAARRDFPNLAGLLAGLGFELEARDADGDTPLVVAAKLGNVKAANALLDAGAKPNAKGPNRKNGAVDVALRTRNVDAAVALLCRGARRKKESSSSGSSLSSRHGGKKKKKKTDDDDELDLVDEDEDELDQSAQSRFEAAQKDWATRELHVDDDDEPPVALPKDKWQPSDDATHCVLCDEPFPTSKLSRRQNHCRHCGTLVCADCSTKSARLKDGHSTDKVRVCDCCFNKLEATRRSRAHTISFHNKRADHRQRGINDTKDSLVAFGNELKDRGDQLKILAHQYVPFCSSS